MGAALAGLLVTLGLPPFGWWPLPILGFAMLTTSVAPARSRGIVFGRMMVFGVGWFGPGLWWMTQFSRPGWILVVLLESLIGAACMVGASGRRSSAWRMVAGVTVGEIVRTRLPLVALPLAGIDLAQARGPLRSEERRVGKECCR